MSQHLAIFDGTSAFVIPNDEHVQYFEIIGESDNIDEVQAIADEYNDKYI